MSEKEIKNLSDEELKQIAIDLYRGKIFTSRHCKTQDDILRAFPVLAFLTKEQWKIVAKAGMIYQYLDRAERWSVNGLPMFFSFRLLSEEDTKKVFEMYRKLKENEEQMLGEKSERSRSS